MFSCKCFVIRVAVFVGCIAGFGVVVPRLAVASFAPQQDAQVLVDYVVQFLKAQVHEAKRSTLQIHVQAPRTKGLTACDTLQAVSPKGLRARTTIQVRCLAPRTWSLHVQTHLVQPGVHYVATRTLTPGQTVGENDVRAVSADLLRLPSDVIGDATQAIGYLVTQRIRKGSVIKSGMLRDAQSIQRGQRVHTEARGPGFVMRGAGQAMQGGPPGSTIQVRTSSGQWISAIVIDAGTVQVPL